MHNDRDLMLTFIFDGETADDGLWHGAISEFSNSYSNYSHNNSVEVYHLPANNFKYKLQYMMVPHSSSAIAKARIIIRHRGLRNGKFTYKLDSDINEELVLNGGDAFTVSMESRREQKRQYPGTATKATPYKVEARFLISNKPA